MSAAILRWADGRETRQDVDPAATEVVVQTPDGQCHYFRATEEIDEHGRDIYVEDAPA